MIFKTTINLYRMKPEDVPEATIIMMKTMFPEALSTIIDWQGGKSSYNTISQQLAHIDDVMALDLPQGTIDLTPLPRLTLPRLAHAALKNLNPNSAAIVREAVHIHLPNDNLIAMRQVIVLENECTETVDDWLNKGWRMLAILPQPNHRRPDYILGTYERGKI